MFWGWCDYWRREACRALSARRDLRWRSNHLASQHQGARVLWIEERRRDAFLWACVRRRTHGAGSAIHAGGSVPRDENKAHAGSGLPVESWLSEGRRQLAAPRLKLQATEWPACLLSVLVAAAQGRRRQHARPCRS